MTCPHMATCIRATWRTRVHIYACVGTRVCVCEISGLRIFSRYSLSPLNTHYLYTCRFALIFCHVGLFVFVFMRR